MRCAAVLSLACLLSPLSLASGQWNRIRTIAGNGEKGAAVDKGPALKVPLPNPFGIQPEADGSLIIAGFEQHVLYRLDAQYRGLERIAGTGAEGLSGSGGEHPVQVALNQPHEVQVDAAGNIYVADTRNHRVGMIEAATGRWAVVAGTGQEGFSGDRGPAKQATMNQAYSIAIDESELFIADLMNQRIRRVDLRSGQINTICGTGEKKPPVDGGLAVEQPLAGPRSLAVDANNLWIVLREGNSVWRLDRGTGRIHHVAGTGDKGFAGDGADARQAKLNGPKGITVDPGVAVYIADTENHAIRKVDLSSGKISTVVGSPQGKAGFNGDGDGLKQRLLSRPHGVCLLKNGELLIGDSENNRVRILTP
ncbi:MAG: hypothetical protein KDA45_14915 [Planctomycetales bacterium]|nr:hypothetical protein [Planctomycetales bacterium]